MLQIHFHKCTHLHCRWSLWWWSWRWWRWRWRWWRWWQWRWFVSQFLILTLSVFVDHVMLYIFSERYESPFHHSKKISDHSHSRWFTYLPIYLSTSLSDIWSEWKNYIFNKPNYVPTYLPASHIWVHTEDVDNARFLSFFSNLFKSGEIINPYLRRASLLEEKIFSDRKYN